MIYIGAIAAGKVNNRVGRSHMMLQHEAWERIPGASVRAAARSQPTAAAGAADCMII